MCASTNWVLLLNLKNYCKNGSSSSVLQQCSKSVLRNISKFVKSIDTKFFYLSTVHESYFKIPKHC